MPAEVDVAVVLDLLDAACSSGVSVPRALGAVGAAVGGARGRRLEQAGTGLLLGSSWVAAWGGGPGTGGGSGDGAGGGSGAGHGLGPVVEALRASWEDGAPPSAGLRAAADRVRRERQARSLEAAGRLGVRLVLPLGLCYLPAFVLVGLMPVLMSLATSALGR
ncbi:type II secretion system F family protein [Actinotalea sp. K2]|uniref:type II secretion system F family protein n=1 Tax=Actinotalea sp. K2 TaxID=2939438 RepID=UPI002016BD9D|nr:type II secretion system F family protein [Actinotalea sp. K2]MCL3861371.1 type II secretion system F family protein [Actinotalea sp. K2]